MEYTDLNQWFLSRPIWVQKAVEVLIDKNEVSEDDFNVLVSICKEEAMGNPLLNSTVDLNVLNSSEKEIKINLLSIENFKGINAIAPNQKIDFHNEHLTIVYGQNGTGKSGYVRTLKHACGAKKPGKLYDNIYSEPSSTQECTINLKVNNITDKIMWNKSKDIDDNLRHIHIYDTDAATAYVNEKNEVEYEPFLLQLFSSVIDICNKVKLKIQEEKETKETNLNRLKLPLKYTPTPLGEWYKSISVHTTQKEITEKINWDDNNEKRLSVLNKDLTKPEISKKRKGINQKSIEIANFKKYLRTLYEAFSDEKCKEYIHLNEEFNRKNEIVLKDAQKVFSSSDLDGVGTETWKLMWKYAKEYSEQKAYPHLDFPEIKDSALCVLCQQELDKNAKKRMVSFQTYITGSLQKDLNQSKQYVEELENSFPDFDKEGTLKLKLRSIGMDESYRLYKEIIDLHDNLLNRKQTLIEFKKIIDPGTISFEHIVSNLDQLINQLNEEDNDLKLLEEGNDDNREIEKNNLECKKWLAEYTEIIQNDLKILNDISTLDHAINLTKTTVYSNKKSMLSELLVTESYIKRFNDELKKLCNNKIKVSLIKEGTNKGKVFHKVILEDPVEKVNVFEVLSEGEFRMVSLAAFLANVESESNIISPFIFDDPISSLDQTYEENTVKRLVELTKYRQVIVFTHRLSLCSIIEDELKKEGLESNFVNLKKGTRGTGIPTDPPFITQKPIQALNSLLNEKISHARKIEDEDYLIYELVVGGICKQVRIITEHIIETHLINQVVKRYRRSITTQNRMHSLALITVEDCDYLDDLMTRFSVYEHYQPDEKPAEIPYLEELEVEIKTLKGWLENFLERQKQYKKQGVMN